ncbi:hypothetical protein KB20921_17330 [Edwardsiella ictaluri]|uniref:Uncharacterized protein n=1 Tax=Edwardsiella ictaluri (strain 93-146) TaxID=634503 RepID=C5B881_EDWI9|nr:hypothetical protein NT01EI_1921 [Edwardsiella ictaluri 93-146]BEH98977.1 hypothetical protein KH20906_17050 [Edwardsiella ictaluri]BEI02472.1 hypothetical protein KB20921_17330 [Edwardsiella ictaluri]BEI05937.1 hypothetical protein KH201010_17230 [Edwardsiella ictaluri]BEI09393.1 hypothetical protein STU22726_17240 [Edwardsiella ictaluri]
MRRTGNVAWLPQSGSYVSIQPVTPHAITKQQTVKFSTPRTAAAKDLHAGAGFSHYPESS